MHIQRVDDGGAFVERFGYCRALRAGNMIFVSGTTADDHGATPSSDVYDQTREALTRVVAAIRELADDAVVVRTRVYLADGDTWEDAGRAHREVFGDARPVNTTVEIGRLIGPGLLVEVEADAVVPE